MGEGQHQEGLGTIPNFLRDDGVSLGETVKYLNSFASEYGAMITSPIQERKIVTERQFGDEDGKPLGQIVIVEVTETVLVNLGNTIDH